MSKRIRRSEMDAVISKEELDSRIADWENEMDAELDESIVKEVEETIKHFVDRANRMLPNGYSVKMRAGRYIVVNRWDEKVFTPEEIIERNESTVTYLMVKGAFRAVNGANEEVEYLEGR